MTVAASIAATWVASSADGLAGFRGTRTAPIPTVARYVMTKLGVFPQITTTRSPRSTPAARSPARRPATSARSAA